MKDEEIIEFEEMGKSELRKAIQSIRDRMKYDMTSDVKKNLTSRLKKAKAEMKKR